MDIVFASNNPGKTAELSALMRGLPIKIISQTALGVAEIEETAPTFVENALLKARHAARATGMPAIADDSGLEVFALNGMPGIYSARYAGIDSNANNNIAKLLTELAHVSDEQRKARFYCALVFLAHADDPTPIICEGYWQGRILKSPQGEKGFGYDPVFYVTTEHCSAAELPLEKKNLLSHRGQALKLLMDKLPTKISL